MVGPTPDQAALTPGPSPVDQPFGAVPNLRNVGHSERHGGRSLQILAGHSECHGGRSLQVRRSSCYDAVTQQTRSTAMWSREASLASLSAMWPTPIAAWWAGPASHQALTNARAPIEKR